MTISPRQPWGRSVPRPDDLVCADSDRAYVAARSSHPDRPVAVTGGDLHRTLGRPRVDGRSELNELPLDLVEVQVDGGEPSRACAHVVARRPWRRGGWWSGPVLLVMNAEFRGTWDVAPRGHPNDGRVETFEIDSSFSLRDRWAARGRLPTASHVPHPAIHTRSVRSAAWEFTVPLEVFADGRCVGSGRRIRVDVLPDEAILLA